MPNISVDDSAKDALVVPLRECGISFENVTESQLFGLLPKHLQPNDISDTLLQKPSRTNQECQQKSDCPFVRHIRDMLRSDEMQSVLKRLVQHQNGHENPTEAQSKDINHLLCFKNIICIRKLHIDF